MDKRIEQTVLKMTNKYKRKCSTFLDIKPSQSGCQHEHNKCWLGWGGKRTLYIVGGNVS
jgi:hypothetical protein